MATLVNRIEESKVTYFLASLTAAPKEANVDRMLCEKGSGWLSRLSVGKL